MKYYCTDWITFLCNLIAIWLIGSGKKYGFLFGLVACATDLIFGFLTESWAIKTSAMLFMIFNLRAYYKWNKNGNKEF